MLRRSARTRSPTPLSLSLSFCHCARFKDRFCGARRERERGEEGREEIGHKHQSGEAERIRNGVKKRERHESFSHLPQPHTHTRTHAHTHTLSLSLCVFLAGSGRQSQHTLRYTESLSPIKSCHASHMGCARKSRNPSCDEASFTFPRSFMGPTSRLSRFSSSPCWKNSVTIRSDHV